MAITLKTFSSSAGRSIGGSTTRNYMSRDDTTSSAALQWFLDAKVGGINTDISGGVPIPPPTEPRTFLTDAAPGQPLAAVAGSLVGPSRAFVAGKEVVVESSTDGRGYLVIEDSPDGVTWTQQSGFALGPVGILGIRFAPLAAQWRVKYYDDASHGSKKVSVFTQLRDPGV